MPARECIWGGDTDSCQLCGKSYPEDYWEIYCSTCSAREDALRQEEEKVFNALVIQSWWRDCIKRSQPKTAFSSCRH